MTIVLFHFHNNFELCGGRIALLRRLNPDVRIYGLYGGEPTDDRRLRELETHGIEHVYHQPRRSPAWYKKNTDLAVAEWYRSIGRFVSFQRVHVLQWDLQFFAPLNVVYPPLPDGAIGLTGLVPLERIADFWDWVVHEPYATGSRRLLEMARRRFDYRDQPYACIGPGYSLSRRFLEAFATLDLEDDSGHDELRLPLFAQILGIEFVDTGFYPRWMDPAVEMMFNADSYEIDPELIGRELKLPGGRRVFHPCRERLTGTLLAQLENLAT